MKTPVCTPVTERVILTTEVEKAQRDATVDLLEYIDARVKTVSML